MPTWFTGLFVSVRIARSATERPRKSHTSPVAAVATASSRESTRRNLRAGADSLEADRSGRARRRRRHGRGRGPPAARTSRIRAPRAARATARTAGRGGYRTRTFTVRVVAARFPAASTAVTKKRTENFRARPTSRGLALSLSALKRGTDAIGSAAWASVRL